MRATSSTVGIRSIMGRVHSLNWIQAPIVNYDSTMTLGRHPKGAPLCRPRREALLRSRYKAQRRDAPRGRMWVRGADAGAGAGMRSDHGLLGSRPGHSTRPCRATQVSGRAPRARRAAHGHAHLTPRPRHPWSPPRDGDRGLHTASFPADMCFIQPRNSNFKHVMARRQTPTTRSLSVS